MEMLYNVIIGVIGTPVNEVQENLAYLCACVLLILAIYALLKLATFFTRIR